MESILMRFFHSYGNEQWTRDLVDNTQRLVEFLLERIPSLREHLHYNPKIVIGIALIVYPFPTGDRRKYWSHLHRRLRADDYLAANRSIQASIAAFRTTTFPYAHNRLLVNWIDVIPAKFIDVPGTQSLYRSTIQLIASKIPKPAELTSAREFQAEIHRRIALAADLRVPMSSNDNSVTYGDLVIIDEEQKKKRQNAQVPYASWTTGTDPNNRTYPRGFESPGTWYSHYTLNWTFQLQFFHRFIHQSIMFVTGATGVGKSAQFPRLARHCRYAIPELFGVPNGKAQAKTVCSMPRKLPVDGTAKYVRRQYMGDYSEVAPNWNEHYVEIRYQDKATINKYNRNRQVPPPSYTYPLTFETDKIVLNDVLSLPLDQQSPKDIQTVMVDESHEHNANMDELLSIVRAYLQSRHTQRLRRLRYPTTCYKLAVISATMDADEDRLNEFFDWLIRNPQMPAAVATRDFVMSPRIHIEDPRLNNRFPRYVHYNLASQNFSQIIADPRNIGKLRITSDYGKGAYVTKGIVDWAVQTCVRAMQRYGSLGYPLIFVPSVTYIKRTIEALHKKLPSNIIALPLFSAMDSTLKDFAKDAKPQLVNIRRDAVTRYTVKGAYIRQKDRLFKDGRGKSPYWNKVIVSTPIAESSITISGLGIVVDTGIQTKPKLDVDTGIPPPIKWSFIDETSSEQRIGRIGRTKPGAAFLLYSRKFIRSSKRHLNIRNEDFTDFLYDFIHKVPNRNRHAFVRDRYGLLYIEHPDSDGTNPRRLFVPRAQIPNIAAGGPLYSFGDHVSAFRTPLTRTPLIDAAYRYLQFFGFVTRRNRAFDFMNGMLQAEGNMPKLNLFDFRQKVFVYTIMHVAAGHMKYFENGAMTGVFNYDRTPLVELVIGSIIFFQMYQGGNMRFLAETWCTRPMDGNKHEGELYLWLRQYMKMHRILLCIEHYWSLLYNSDTNFKSFFDAWATIQAKNNDRWIEYHGPVVRGILGDLGLGVDSPIKKSAQLPMLKNLFNKQKRLFAAYCKNYGLVTNLWLEVVWRRWDLGFQYSTHMSDDRLDQTFIRTLNNHVPGLGSIDPLDRIRLAIGLSHFDRIIPSTRPHRGGRIASRVAGERINGIVVSSSLKSGNDYKCTALIALRPFVLQAIQTFKRTRLNT